MRYIVPRLSHHKKEEFSSKILTNFLFGAFSFEMKHFYTKFYFTYILVPEFEKKKKEIH
jgi:hypothetical protein